MSLLVMLGAGASYDSVHVDDAIPDGRHNASAMAFRPPLLNGIFEPRFQTFAQVMSRTPIIAPLVVELRRAINGGLSLEAELDKVHARAIAGDAASARQLMGMRFYLREIIEMCSQDWPSRASSATNYHWLVARLDRWAIDTGEQVCYVTFNYDTLLETAITDTLGQDFNLVADYAAHPRAKVYKPHGSVDWGHLIQREGPFTTPERDWVIANAATVQPGEVSMRKDWASGTTGRAWVPAIAVPIYAKDVFVLPPGHSAALLEDLKNVSRVMIVGWRATEKKFLTLAHSAIPKQLRSFLALCHTEQDGNQARAALLPHAAISSEAVTASRDFSQVPGDPGLDEFLAN